MPKNERLALLEYFDIKPEELAGTLVFFWLNVEQSTREHQELLGEAFFT